MEYYAVGCMVMSTDDVICYFIAVKHVVDGQFVIDDVIANECKFLPF